MWNNPHIIITDTDCAIDIIRNFYGEQDVPAAIHTTDYLAEIDRLGYCDMRSNLDISIHAPVKGTTQ